LGGALLLQAVLHLAGASPGFVANAGGPTAMFFVAAGFAGLRRWLSNKAPRWRVWSSPTPPSLPSERELDSRLALMRSLVQVLRQLATSTPLGVIRGELLEILHRLAPHAEFRDDAGPARPEDEPPEGSA